MGLYPDSICPYLHSSHTLPKYAQVFRYQYKDAAPSHTFLHTQGSLLHYGVIFLQCQIFTSLWMCAFSTTGLIQHVIKKHIDIARPSLIERGRGGSPSMEALTQTFPFVERFTIFGNSGNMSPMGRFDTHCQKKFRRTLRAGCAPMHFPKRIVPSRRRGGPWTTHSPTFSLAHQTNQNTRTKTNRRCRSVERRQHKTSKRHTQLHSPRQKKKEQQH